MELPARFVERLDEQLGAAEAARLRTALDGEPPVSIRLNPSREGGEALLRRLGCRAAVPWCDGGYYLSLIHI